MLIDQTNAEDAAGIGETLHARHMILLKGIVTDLARSTAHVFRTPADTSWHGMDGTTPRDGNPTIGSIRLTSPVRIGGSNICYSSRTGNQYIINPRGSIGPQWIRDDQPLDTSINGNYSEHRDPAPIFSKLIGRKFIDESSADVNSRFRMNFGSDTVLTKSPNFVNLGLASVHISDGLRSVFITTNIIRTPKDSSNWIPTSHRIGEVALDRVIRAGSEQDYNAKTDFKTRRENQDFGRQNNSTCRPHLDLTTLGMNTINGTTSPIDSIPVEKKTPDPTPLTQPTESSEQNGKAHVPGELDPDPSLPESQSNKSNLSNDSNYSKLIKKKSDKNKNRHKNNKNITRQTHRQAIMIHPKTVTTDARDVKKKSH